LQEILERRSTPKAVWALSLAIWFELMMVMIISFQVFSTPSLSQFGRNRMAGFAVASVVVSTF